jgi:ABC-2 type transport system permease protein
MTADVRPAAVTRPVGLPARLVGLGSVFGKSVRDGRRGALVVGGLASIMMFVGAAALAAEWSTADQRRELLASIDLLPVTLKGLLGDPIRIDTLGGFLSWRFGNILPVMIGIWSVLTLSGTLAIEARRGSLDLLAATPVSRRRIALEKVLAHVALVALAMLAASVAATVAGAALGTVPGDEIPFVNALGHFTLTGLIIVAAGLTAFAVAPILGRGRAGGLGAIVLFGGYLVLSYRSVATALEAIQPLSWYAWTAGHRPLAGQWDWPPVLLLAAVCVALLAAGVVAFERRDIGVSLAADRFRLPGLPVGTRNPFTRQLGDRTGVAIGAGIGIGLYGGLIASSADAFIESLSSMPGIDELIARLYPGVDIAEPTGILQLAFFAFGTVLVAFAAAAFVAGWASDETEDRLDFLLSTPRRRMGWFLAGAAGVYAAIALAVAIAVLVITAGVVSAGGDVGGLAGGGVVLALFGAAFAGLGLAVGGLGRPAQAGIATGALAVGSYLLALLGNALQLPDWIVDLSLNEHVGQPLAGIYDEVGLVAMIGLAIGGPIVGALGFRARDIQR